MGERILYLDFLKGVSIPLVVMLHVAAVGLSEEDINSFSWQVCNVFDALTRFVVPIFLMVSGAIFLNSQKVVSVCKSVKRLLIPLIFWSLAYSFVVNLSHSYLIDWNWIVDFLTLAFITPTHTWFLYMLIGLYILIPLLRSIVSNKRTEEYFLVLWLIFGIVLPSLNIFPSVYFIADSIVDKLYFYLPLGYSGYFVLGHYLHNFYNHSLKCYWPLVASILVLSIMIMWITTILSLKQGCFDGWAYEYLNPLVASISIFVFLSVRYLCTNKYISRIKVCINNMAKLSLGIYLLHVPVMILFRHWGFDYALCNSIVAIPLVSIFIYLISFVIIYIISKVPYLKNYII